MKRHLAFAVTLLLTVTLDLPAAPIITVDLDPVTPGVQSTLSVAPSATFTVDVLLSDDGTGLTPVAFDSVVLETLYNDMGAGILGAGPTGPVAGSLTALAGTLDVNAFAPVAPGSALTAGPSAPPPPFANGTGSIALLNATPFMQGPGPASTIYSIDFTALAPGMSSVRAAGTPAGSPELAIGGAPIFATIVAGTVTVTPEPSTTCSLAALLAVGALLARRRRLASRFR